MLTVAIALLELFQLTPLVVEVRSTDLPLLIFEMFVEEIFTEYPDITVILQVAEEVDEAALIVVEPLALAVTTP